MSTYASPLLASTVIVAVLVGALAFVVFKFVAASRGAKHQVRRGGAEAVLLSTALHDAVSSMKAREQEMSARAVASEQLSEQVFDSLTAGLVVVDASGRVTNVNPAARRMLSTVAEPNGLDYRELLAVAPPLVEVVAEGLVARGPVVRRSVHVQDPARSWYVAVTVSPLGDPDARHGAICLLSDVTTVVELEQQLQLKEALARLGELTAGIAHEFRNGLATIHGYSRLIDPDTLPDAHRTCLQGIRSETDALGQVVAKFLDFARPESISFVPVNLEALVHGAADDLRPELPPLTMLTVSGTFGVVAGDEVLLRQAVDNLIRNAAEASAVEGTAPRVTVSGQVDAAKRQAILSVDDNGPGIPESIRAQIFQPFFTTRARGSGLGLSIVQKIVLLHNGKISAASAPAGGARLQLVLPLATS